MAERSRLRAWLGSLIRWLLMTVLVCAALGVVGHRLILDRLNDEIRSHVQGVLARQYPGLDISVQSARRIPGRGIEIRGLSIKSGGAQSAPGELVHMDEAVVGCRTELTELLGGRLCVRDVTIRRLKIRATRQVDGTWNIATLFPLPKLGGQLPRIALESASLELRDLSKPEGATWALREIDLRAVPGPRDPGSRTLKLNATLAGDHFKRVRVQGGVNLDTGACSVTGTIDDLEASPRMLAALPTEAATYLSLLQTLRTRAHLGFRVTHDRARDVPTQWVVDGRLTEGRIDDARLPYPLTGLEADLYCDQDRLSIENLVAQSGPSVLELSAHCDNFMTQTISLDVSAHVQGLALDERLYAILPPSLQSQWEKFAPAGIVDATVQLQTRDGRLAPQLLVTCRDVSLAYHKFPYRLQRVRGTLRYADNLVRLEEFVALAADQTVRFAGQFRNPGPTAVGFLTVRSDGPIPLDEKLLAALQPDAQRVVRSLQPTGHLSLVEGRLERAAADQPSQTTLELDLQDCSIQFERFPYPIQKIHGKLLARNRTWRFQNLRGKHYGADIEANGRWIPASPGEKGGELLLSLQGRGVPLDDSLRDAIGTRNPAAKQFWNSLQPRGAVDRLGVTIHYESDTRQTRLEVQADKWRADPHAERRSLSVHPQWLPLRLDDLTGSVWYTNGRFELRKVAATHEDATIELSGRGSVSADGDWDVTLTRLLAEQVQLNEKVIEAVPEPARQALRELRLSGPLNLDGSAWFRGAPRTPLTAGWDVMIDIENGALQNRAQVEHIFGAVRLYGNKWANGFSSRGELEIDSLTCRGIQVTGVRGPFWMDANQLILGARAEPKRPDRLPRQLRAHVWDGSLVVEGRLSFQDQLPFAVDVTLTGGSVAQMARSFRRTQADLTGRVFATLRMSGTQAGVHTYRGNGRVRLVDADIYELPVMVAMLSVLSLRPPDTTAFTSADVDLRLNGDQIYLDRIDFSGDAISLKGQGWMDLNRQINASFYALVGRQEFQLPLVRALLAEASRNILLIQVSGPLDHPQVTRKALPELDETLQRLFPEGAPARAGAPRGVPTLGRAAPDAATRTR